METKVVIYGKDSCPYTRAALEDYRGRGVPVTYHDVTRDPDAMRAFLELSGGQRLVPLISDRGRLSAGFGGS